MKRKLVLVVTITAITIALTTWAATLFDTSPRVLAAQAPQPMSVPF